MRVRIHRGAHEIGGNCIEVQAADGRRIVLDVGRPLSAGWDDEPELPDVSGFTEPDTSLAGVVISHPHLDHYGLVAGIRDEVPVYIGREAASLLAAASFFSPISGRVEPAGFLEHGVPLAIGPFTVTPFLNDHSAFDAYSLLIEADGRRVFYTGDFRGHGRKAAIFEGLLAHPPERVDVLLMEGTHVRAGGAHDDQQFETESELEDRFVAACKETAGAVVVLGSAQNLDRVVTVFRAARSSGRTFVIDLYGATVAAATRPTIPQPGFDGLRVYVPQRQRVRVKEAEEFWRVADVRDDRIFPEELASEPGRYLLHVPSSTTRELIRTAVLGPEGFVAWSLWSGYLDMPSGKTMLRELERAGIPFVQMHTSGHASVRDLRRLVDALRPDRVVPIHSEATDRFVELFPGVEQHADGEWWEV